MSLLHQNIVLLVPFVPQSAQSLFSGNFSISSSALMSCGWLAAPLDVAMPSADVVDCWWAKKIHSVGYLCELLKKRKFMNCRNFSLRRLVRGIQLVCGKEENVKRPAAIFAVDSCLLR
jgi:hypothetical protein